MDKKTINAMLKAAKTNGVAEIVYTTSMSSSATLGVYLTRYPNAEDGDAQKFAEVLADYDKKLKPSDFLDTVSAVISQTTSSDITPTATVTSMTATTSVATWIRSKQSSAKRDCIR